MGKSDVISNISIDCVILGFKDSILKVLLIKRSNDFMKSQWALPGHNIRSNESGEDAAFRILYDMSGLENIYLEQIAAFSDLKRVDKQRIVTIAYMALVNIQKHKLRTIIPEAEDVSWFGLGEIPKLALDHNKILEVAIFKLKRRFRFEPLGFELLPTKFSLKNLQDLYESLFGIEFDNRNFRKKLLKMGHLIQLDEKQTNVSHRSAELYKFDRNGYNRLCENGINIDILPKTYLH